MNSHETKFTLLIGVTRLVRNVLSGLVPPLIPILAVALDYPLWQLGLLVTIFSLGSGLGQAPFGYLSDIYDRRYILPTGIAIAGGSYLLFALAPAIAGRTPTIQGLPFETTFVVMSISMLICGVATAVVHPTVYPMISENVREANKGKVLGVFGSAAKAGDGTTPLIVGVLILVLIWEGIVALVGATGIVFAVLLFLLLDDFDTTPVETDSTGNGKTEDGEETVWEADNREYVYPMVVIYLFFITRGFAGKGLKTFIPAFIVGIYGYTIDAGGLSFAAESVANFYFSALLLIGASTQIALGWIVDRYDYGPRPILMGCMTAATGGILALAFLPLSPLWLIAVLLVIGAGVWGLNPARDVLISRITPAQREGRTFGYLWTASHLTSAIIPTLVGYIADVFGLRHSFGVLALGSLFAVVSVSLLYSNRIYVETARAPPQREALD